MRLKPNLFFSVALLLVLFSCKKDKSPYPHEFLENQVVDEVNAYRVSIGLPELIVDDKIVEQARNHSKNMAENMVPFSHDGFHERIDNLRIAFPCLRSSGENISFGYDNAKAVVTAWLQSEGHKDNIEGDFTHNGVGIAVDKDETYFYTHLFISIEE